MELVCPVCRGELAERRRCSACGRAYEEYEGVVDYTPSPLPDYSLRTRQRLWAQLEANGARAYQLDPPSSLSIGERVDANAFAAFCEFQGLALDVGCGPQRLPSYADGLGEGFVGLDPLRGEQPRAFAFVRGIAEYLPFRNASFDRVLFATSLDHVLDPRRALAEARRVAKPGGAVCIWIGLPPPESLRSRLRRWFPRERTIEVKTPSALMRFRVPAGAVDAFHVRRPTLDQVEEWLASTRLRIDEVRQWPNAQHCFIRARF